MKGCHSTNTYFRHRFNELYWKIKPLATSNNNNLISDFRKTFSLDNEESITIQIEVEFGNTASSYRNLFKL